MKAVRRTFRIETLSKPREAVLDGDGVRHHEIMAELRELRALVSGDARGGSVQPEMIDAWRREIAEAQKLKIELDAIQAAIESTKLEIATLHTSGFEGPEMRRVTCELDAIVSGTENATEQILAAAEHIDEKAMHLQAAIKDDHDRELAVEVQEHVVRIFEACNFQDLTGQRITKVVNTLKFIEERIVRMMEIWGGMESFEGIEVERMPVAEGDKSLLNGPALDTDINRASQDEIDALFA